ncbi:hypothetical protein CCACVL1_11287 [Corchorus capsularis]|uniref:Uncharacterized protein n=1 Tax=Corchorus capsularis TaxID=210143 RepID=A0A1R3IM50_COCAP|nr:hypothetical protein CCACVL1_11287 [Corchorus capsularis]
MEIIINFRSTRQRRVIADFSDGFQGWLPSRRPQAPSVWSIGCSRPSAGCLVGYLSEKSSHAFG